VRPRLRILMSVETGLPIVFIDASVRPDARYDIMEKQNMKLDALRNAGRARWARCSARWPCRAGDSSPLPSDRLQIDASYLPADLSPVREDSEK